MWKNVAQHKGFWIGLILSCAGLAVALSGVGLKEIASELTAVPWAGAIAAAGVAILANVIRSYRWKIGVESFAPVSFKNAFSAFHVGIFGVNVIPMRIGEYLRVYVLGKNSSISQSSILATVVFERLIDGLTILTLFAVSLSLVTAADAQSMLGGGRRDFLLWIPLIFVLSLGLLYAVRRRPECLARMLGRVAGGAGIFGGKIPGILDRFLVGLVIFSDLRRLFLYILWSFISWLTISFYFYLNFLLLDIHLGFAEAVVVLSVTVVGVMIPAAPGFVGTYHAFCKAAMVAFGVDEARALSFAVVTHALPYALSTFVGFICAMRENVRLTDLSPK